MLNRLCTTLAAVSLVALAAGCKPRASSSQVLERQAPSATTGQGKPVFFLLVYGRATDPVKMIGPGADVLEGRLEARGYEVFKEENLLDQDLEGYFAGLRTARPELFRGLVRVVVTAHGGIDTDGEHMISAEVVNRYRQYQKIFPHTTRQVLLPTARGAGPEAKLLFLIASCYSGQSAAELSDPDFAPGLTGRDGRLSAVSLSPSNSRSTGFPATGLIGVNLMLDMAITGSSWHQQTDVSPKDGIASLREVLLLVNSRGGLKNYTPELSSPPNRPMRESFEIGARRTLVGPQDSEKTLTQSFGDMEYIIGAAPTNEQGPVDYLKIAQGETFHIGGNYNVADLPFFPPYVLAPGVRASEPADPVFQDDHAKEVHARELKTSGKSTGILIEPPSNPDQRQGP